MEPRAPLPASAAPEAITAGSRAPRAASGAPAPPTVQVPAHVPALVALSEDPALLQALTTAVIERAAVVTSPSVDRFVDQLVSNTAEVALIDATSAPNPITAFLRGLRRQLPQLRVIVAGTAALQEQLRDQIADGTVFRYVLKPASVQRLTPMLCTALRIGPPPALTGRSSDGPARVADTQRPVIPPSSGLREPDDRATQPADPGAADETRGSTAPRWVRMLLLCLTGLGAMLVGWYASSFASHSHLLP